MVAKSQKIVAHALEVAEDDLEYDGGTFRVKGTDRTMTVKESAFAAWHAHDLPDGLEPALEETAVYDPSQFSWPSGTHIAVVEVDTETGAADLVRYVAVDDVGNVINPQIVDGQVHGGIAQGVAQALWEEAVYDEGGNLLTGSLVNYLVPSAAELPTFEVDRTITVSPNHPLGAKGVGETGTIASTPAVVNAVLDALAPLGVTDIDMPVDSGTSLAGDRGGTVMIPARFDYEVAESVDQAIELLGSSDDAKLLAGGHSLLPLMKLRFAQPTLLVDIGRLSDLGYVREDGDRIAIGALTRHHDVANDALLRKANPLVATTAAGIGDPQVRHVGTIGGSVAHGDPAADMPAVLVALEAELVARGPKGERTIAAGRLLHGLPRDGAGAAGGAHRDPRAEGRGRLRQVPPPRSGLGDGRRGRRPLERLHSRCADEHGRDARSRRGGRG